MTHQTFAQFHLVDLRYLSRFLASGDIIKWLSWVCKTKIAKSQGHINSRVAPAAADISITACAALSLTLQHPSIDNDLRCIQSLRSACELLYRIWLELRILAYLQGKYWRTPHHHNEQHRTWCWMWLQIQCASQPNSWPTCPTEAKSVGKNHGPLNVPSLCHWSCDEAALQEDMLLALAYSTRSHVLTRLLGTHFLQRLCPAKW